MKNYVQLGAVVPLIAAAAVTSGQGVLFGGLFGVAGHDAAIGAPLELHVEGIYDLPKAPSQAWALGALVYWTGTACTTVAGSNKLIGVAVATTGAGAGETIGRVRLNGAGVTP